MGQISSTDETADENGGSLTQQNESRERDFQFLIGKLESFPDSARKLFNLGRQYLTTGVADEGGGSDGFCALFQPLNSETQDDTREDAKPISTGMMATPLRKSAPLHHLQTYIQWKAGQDLTNFYSLCLPKRHTIYLKPIGFFPEFVQSFRMRSHGLDLSLFETIQTFLQVFLCGLEVTILPAISLVEAGESIKSRTHPVTGSQQLCLNDIYPVLERLLPPSGLYMLGISWLDLYPEGYNFALGEASVKHRAAVISFGRFETKGFDASTHQDISKIDGGIIWKLIKSSSHELCHLVGLQHCSFFRCAMNESMSVEEAMNQPLFLCPVCLRKLQHTCGFDVLERYTLLHRFLSGLTEHFTEEKRLQDSLAWLDRCISYLNS